MRVLLVEDSDAGADSVAEAIAREHGVALERVTSALEATRSIAKVRFDAVLVTPALHDHPDADALKKAATYTPLVVLRAASDVPGIVTSLRAVAISQEEMLAMIAHKLRTPLTTILGWTHLLRAGKVADVKYARTFETIERNAQAQVAFIEDMLVTAGIAEKTEPGGPRSLRASNGRELEGLKVLLVEDDTDTRAILTVLLVTMGASISVASSVEEALALVEGGRHDVIVSDIEMGETSGYELLARIRARAATDGGRTPAIALTGHARELDRDRATEAGFDEHLAKPVDPALLVRAVLRVVALRPPFASV